MIRRALLLFLVVAAASANAADLSVRFFPPQRAVALPGAQVFMLALVENRTENEPANIHVTITFDPKLAIDEVSHWPFLWECTSKPGQIDCTNPEFRIGSDGQIRFTLLMPDDPAGGDYAFRAEVTSTTEDPNAANNVATTSVHVTRQMIVSNTDDSGPGSLRQAIIDANGWCTATRPCEIRFRFPDGPILPIEPPVRVIEPLTPLPALTACDVRVGDPPAEFSDRAPMQVELSGRRLSAGHGLELRSACATGLGMILFGMTINGFPGDGIVTSTPAHYQLNSVNIGTDAKGTRAIPNRGRGVAHLPDSQLSVAYSLIGGNERSGIAILGGQTVISKSRIGIGYDGQDLRNGASGIFIAPAARSVSISESVIANHPHFGIAHAGSGGANISANTILTHNGLDFDWFLDGPTDTIARADIPPTPRVQSATYDAAANETRVTLTGVPNDASNRLRLYASDRITIYGTAHLETILNPSSGIFNGATLVVQIPGDLRGKYVSAVNTRWSLAPFIDSPPPVMLSMSEVSTAVKVD